MNNTERDRPTTKLQQMNNEIELISDTVEKSNIKLSSFVTRLVGPVPEPTSTANDEGSVSGAVGSIFESLVILKEKIETLRAIVQRFEDSEVV